MRRVTAFAVGAAIAAVLYGSAEATAKYSFGGLLYAFPSSHAAKILANDGSGTLTWSADAGTDAVPSGVIAYTINGSCPSGWTEFTDARGRYIVGLVSGGTLDTPVGTALSNTENRLAGQHLHTATVPVTVLGGTHNHGVSDSGHAHTGMRIAGYEVRCDVSCPTVGPVDTNGQTNSSSSTISVNNNTSGISPSIGGFTLDASGTGSYTNAPYVQLMACVKS